MKQEIMEWVEKIRNGEVPEGYRKTKVGIIPVEWEMKKLGDAAEVVMGQSPVGTSYNHSGTGAPLINGPTEFTEKYPIKIQWTSQPTKFCKKGDILLCVRGSSTGRMNISDDEYCIGRGVAAIRAKSGADTLFITFQVESAVKSILTLTTGSTFPNIDGKSIKTIQFPLPPLSEQEKIAKIISTWDKAIELKEKRIEEIKGFKRGMMQKLLVGKLRFKEYIKSPNLQEVKRYTTLPEDWSIKKSSTIFSHVSIKNNGNEQLLSATQNNGVIPRDMLDGDVMSPSGDTNSYKLVEEGDFVISLRSFQGGLEYSCYRGVISPAYTVLKNKIPICEDFYRHLFKSRLFIDRLASSVIGIRDGKQISYDDFSFMVLPYPELKEQEKIASMLNNIDDNIELLKSELNQYKEQKRGLMQLLLTGIVRVQVD